MRFLSTFTCLLLIPLVAVLPIQAAAAEAPSGSVPTTQPNSLQVRLADAAQPVVEANSTFKGYSILVTDSTGAPVADAAVALRLPDEGPTGFFMNGDRSAVAYTNAAGVAAFNQINWNSSLGSALVRITVVKGEQHAGAMIEQTIVSHVAATTATSAASPVPSAVLKPLPTPTAPASPTAVPGTPVSVAAVHTGASDVPHPNDKPAATPAAQPAASPEPVVSIVNTAGSAAPHSNKKWILLAVVGVAAGVGAAVALSGKGAAPVASSNTTSLSIGSPSISVGH